MAGSHTQSAVSRWLAYRMIVQRWDETVCTVAEKDLSPEDFQLLEHSILEDSNMDQELLSVLARRPPVFHLGMLPSLSQGGIQADDAAKAIHVAKAAMAGGLLKVLEAELQADWALVSEMALGHSQLRELLKWIELEHRRTQAQVGHTLVARRIAKFHPTIDVHGWENLAGQVSVLCKTMGNVHGTRRAIILLDFNAPWSRDSLKLPKMVQSIATLTKNLGTENVAVLAWMPNTSKEGSTTPPERDEQDIALAFQKSGFTSQLRIRQLFDLHPSVANKTEALDWFADGRLMCIGEAKDNWFLQHSEMARTRRVMQVCTLPLAKDLVPMHSLSENADINVKPFQADVPFKCAQRGPHVAEVQLTSLLHKVPLDAKDETVIIDVMPHVGDRQLGIHQFIKSQAAENRGLFRGVIVNLVAKGGNAGEYHAKATAITQRRLSNQIFKEWFDRSMVLYDSQQSAAGVITEVPVYPVDTVQAPAR